MKVRIMSRRLKDWASSHYRREIRPFGAGEHGFALIGAFVAIALLSVVFLAYLSAHNNELWARKSISARKQPDEVYQSLSNEVVNQFNLRIGYINSVAALATNVNFGQLPISNGARLRFDSATYLTLPCNDSVPSSLATSLERCQRNTTVTDTFYHFCLGLERDPDAPQGSFAAAAYGVLELSIKTKNLQTSADFTRAEYLHTANDSVAGLEVYYMLHWANTA